MVEQAFQQRNKKIENEIYKYLYNTGEVYACNFEKTEK